MITTEQKELVQISFEKIVPVSEAVARLFYRRLFELDPSIQPLFSKDIHEPGRKFMVMLRSMVKSLERLNEFTPGIEAMGQRHIGYGTEIADYETLKEALKWSLAKGLGSDFTPEVKNAWIEVYDALAEMMKRAATKAA